MTNLKKRYKRWTILLWVTAIAAIIAAILYLVKPEPEKPFHPNAIARDSGAVICPDSPGARSIFHEKDWDETLDDDLKKVQSGGVVKAPDLSPYGCTGLVSGTAVYIESTDSTGIATVTAKLSDGTVISGITRSDMVPRS
jgi:hypothetical protein